MIATDWHLIVKGYEPMMTFDAANAEVYDGLAVRGDEEATVDFLAAMLRAVPRLELAIGTGRIALPLAATGVPRRRHRLLDAHGGEAAGETGRRKISTSPSATSQTSVCRPLSLIYVVFNSFFNLLTQDDQVRCFENVASHLTDDGAFVIEGGCTLAFIDHLRAGQYVDAKASPSIRCASISCVSTLRRNAPREPRTRLQDGVTFNPVMQRYAWPSELDLMARFAGLRLRERWGGWHRQAFTANSDNVISVYRR